MEQSPLTQQLRPEIFQPKIVQLYEKLFGWDEEDYFDDTDGFWEEFFLLRPDGPNFRRVLGSLSSDDLLQLQVCRCLISRAFVDGG